MTVSSKSHQEKEQEGGRSGGKIKTKLYEVNKRAVSRGKFMKYTYIPTRIKRKLVRFGMDYYWKGQIVEIVGRRTVAIHSNEQTLHLYRIFTYI